MKNHSLDLEKEIDDLSVQCKDDNDNTASSSSQQ